MCSGAGAGVDLGRDFHIQRLVRSLAVVAVHEGIACWCRTLADAGLASRFSVRCIRSWRPLGTLDGYTDAQTMAAIGKATLVIEEQQNWGSQ